MSRLRLLAAALLASACAPESFDPSPGRTRLEIIGGTINSGDPAVVSLQIQGSHFCTGTLVAPKTILTAAHCLEGLPAGYPVHATFGTYAETAPTRSVRTVKGIGHPSYSSGLGYDVGVMQLETAVTDIAPIAINPTPLTQADVGKPLRHIGFGVTNGTTGDGAGIKRVGVHPIIEMTSLEVAAGSTGKQGCYGDSGGPGVMVTAGSTAERVVGVISHAYPGDQGCQYGGGWDSRVDAYAQWIAQTSAPWEASCAADGACVPGCAPVDPDCACAADGQCTTACADLTKDPDCPKDCVQNGVCAEAACPAPDPDCRPDGAACTSPAQCANHKCVTDPQHAEPYCSRACASVAECPLGKTCTGGLCLHTQLPVLAEGQTCTPSTSRCEGSLVCSGPLGVTSTCRRSCADCAPGGTCEAGSHGQTYCVPPPPPMVVLPKARLDAPAATGCESAGGPPLGLVLLALASLALRRRT